MSSVFFGGASIQNFPIFIILSNLSKLIINPTFIEKKQQHLWRIFVLFLLLFMISLNPSIYITLLPYIVNTVNLFLCENNVHLSTLAKVLTKLMSHTNEVSCVSTLSPWIDFSPFKYFLMLNNERIFVTRKNTNII